MGELIGGVVVAVIFITAMVLIAWIGTHDASAPQIKKTNRTLELENHQLRTNLMDIEQVVRDNYDASPVFADVVLAEINKQRRKELGK